MLCWISGIFTEDKTISAAKSRDKASVQKRLQPPGGGFFSEYLTVISVRFFFRRKNIRKARWVENLFPRDHHALEVGPQPRDADDRH